MPTIIEKAREALKVLFEEHGCLHTRKCGVELRFTVTSVEDVERAQRDLGRIEVRHGVAYWKRAGGEERIVPVYKRASVERFFREVKPKGYTKYLAALKGGEPVHKARGRKA